MLPVLNAVALEGGELITAAFHPAPPDLLSEFAARREQAGGLEVFDQALLGGWCELAVGVRRAFADEDADVARLLEFYAERAAGYEPADDRERDPIASYFGSTVSGVWFDLGDGGPVPIEELGSALGALHQLIRRQAGTAPLLYGPGVLMRVVTDLSQQGFSFEEIAPATAVVHLWQRLAWLAECRLQRGAVVAGGREEPLVGEEDEQLIYLMRLAANQPGLGQWPELARFLPRRADGLLPLSERAYRRFRRERIPDDPQATGPRRSSRSATTRSTRSRWSSSTRWG